MSCIIHQRIDEYKAEEERLEARVERYRNERSRLEAALELADHPPDFCLCQDGLCPRCTATASQQQPSSGSTGPPADPIDVVPQLEHCKDPMEVCEFLAWSNPTGDNTLKLGDAVRAYKQVGLYTHLKNNSVRGTIEKMLNRSPMWVFLGEGTFVRLIGPVPIPSTPERQRDTAGLGLAA
ncbi:MAG: hypothetical protein OXN21_13845 [Chloroflexota bacterium]|nr:hypothetical protein [Chloroflexota bacterium]